MEVANFLVFSVAAKALEASEVFTNKTSYAKNNSQRLRKPFSPSFFVLQTFNPPAYWANKKL